MGNCAGCLGVGPVYEMSIAGQRQMNNHLCYTCLMKLTDFIKGIEKAPQPISFNLAVEQVRKGKQFEVFGNESRKGILTKIVHSSVECCELYYFKTEGNEFRFDEHQAIFFLSHYKWIEVK